MNNNKLGINIIQPEKHGSDVLFTDNTLHMHTACMVPFADGVDNDEGDTEQIANHIIKNVMRIYTSFATNCTMLILCDDGCKSFKPAVRDTRDLKPDNEVQKYYRANVTALTERLFGELEDKSIPFIHIRGRNNETNNKGAITVGAMNPDDPDDMYHLGEFAQIMKSCESDQLMFELVCHLRKKGSSLVITIMSKDSDIVATAMALLELKGEDCLGNTYIGFMNTMFHKSEVAGHVHIKDFDLAVDNMGWNTKLTLNDKNNLRSRPAFTIDDDDDIPDAVWDWAYDCANASVVFADTFDKLHELMLRKTLSVKKLMTFIKLISMEGIRGPAFRRCMEWLTAAATIDTKPPHAVAMWNFFTDVVSGSGKTLVKQFVKDVYNAYATCTDKTDNWTINKKSHAAAVQRNIKRYVDDEFEYGTYGKYLDMLSSSRYTIFMRLSRTEYTRRCVVLCGLAGTDYNVNMIKLSGSKIVSLLTDSTFAQICNETGLEVNKPDWKLTARRLFNAANIGTTEPSTTRHPDIIPYVHCVWQTLHYTMHTWALQFPEANEVYGYKNGTFTCKIPNSSLFTVGKARSSV